MTGILELVGDIKVGPATPHQVLETGAALFLLPAVTCGNFSGLWISSSMFFLGKSVLPIGSDTSDCSRRELSRSGGPLRCSQEPWGWGRSLQFLDPCSPWPYSHYRRNPPCSASAAQSSSPSTAPSTSISMAAMPHLLRYWCSLQRIQRDFREGSKEPHRAAGRGGDMFELRLNLPATRKNHQWGCWWEYIGDRDLTVPTHQVVL